MIYTRNCPSCNKPTLVVNDSSYYFCKSCGINGYLPTDQTTQTPPPNPPNQSFTLPPFLQILNQYSFIGILGFFITLLLIFSLLSSTSSFQSTISNDLSTLQSTLDTNTHSITTTQDNLNSTNTLLSTLQSTLSNTANLSNSAIEQLNDNKADILSLQSTLTLLSNNLSNLTSTQSLLQSFLLSYGINTDVSFHIDFYNQTNVSIHNATATLTISNCKELHFLFSYPSVNITLANTSLTHYTHTLNPFLLETFQPQPNTIIQLNLSWSNSTYPYLLDMNNTTTNLKVNNNYINPLNHLQTTIH